MHDQWLGECDAVLLFYTITKSVTFNEIQLMTQNEVLGYREKLDVSMKE